MSEKIGSEVHSPFASSVGSTSRRPSLSTRHVASKLIAALAGSSSLLMRIAAHPIGASICLALGYMVLCGFVEHGRAGGAVGRRIGIQVDDGRGHHRAGLVPVEVADAASRIGNAMNERVKPLRIILAGDHVLVRTEEFHFQPLLSPPQTNTHKNRK